MEKAVSEILVRLFQLAPQQFAPHLHTSLVLVRKKKKSTDWPVFAEVAGLVLPAQAGTQLWSVLVAIAAFAIRRSFSAVRASPARLAGQRKPAARAGRQSSRSQR